MKTTSSPNKILIGFLLFTSMLTLACGGDRTVRLWDMGTGQLRRTLAGQSDWVCTVAFSPDNQFYVDTWSRVDMAPVTQLRRASDQAVVMT